jgi:hypothetical protein
MTEQMNCAENKNWRKHLQAISRKHDFPQLKYLTQIHLR